MICTANMRQWRSGLTKSERRPNMEVCINVGAFGVRETVGRGELLPNVAEVRVNQQPMDFRSRKAEEDFVSMQSFKTMRMRAHALLNAPSEFQVKPMPFGKVPAMQDRAKFNSKSRPDHGKKLQHTFKQKHNFFHSGPYFDRTVRRTATKLQGDPNRLGGGGGFGIWGDKSPPRIAEMQMRPQPRNFKSARVGEKDFVSMYSFNSKQSHAHDICDVPLDFGAKPVLFDEVQALKNRLHKLQGISELINRADRKTLAKLNSRFKQNHFKKLHNTFKHKQKWFKPQVPFFDRTIRANAAKLPGSPNRLCAGGDGGGGRGIIYAKRSVRCGPRRQYNDPAPCYRKVERIIKKRHKFINQANFMENFKCKSTQKKRRQYYNRNYINNFIEDYVSCTYKLSAIRSPAMLKRYKHLIRL